MDSKEHRNAVNAEGESMKILSVEQGSAIWLALRSNYVTGTDSAIILGSSPYKSKLDLWQQKMGLKEPDKCNERMKRGSELELPARLLLQKSLGMEFTPIVAVSDEYPYLMASLDGISDCNRFMCEIKCPSIKGHEAAINGVIAPYYIDQINHCLLVTGCEMCYFCSYFPGHEKEIEVINVYSNHEKQMEIIEKGYEFYMQMCNFEEPKEWKLNKK